MADGEENPMDNRPDDLDVFLKNPPTDPARPAEPHWRRVEPPPWNGSEMPEIDDPTDCRGQFITEPIHPPFPVPGQTVEEP